MKGENAMLKKILTDIRSILKYGTGFRFRRVEKHIGMAKKLMLKHYPILRSVTFKTWRDSSGYSYDNNCMYINEIQLLDNQMFSTEINDALIEIGKPSVPRHLYTFFVIFHEYGHAHGSLTKEKSHRYAKPDRVPYAFKVDKLIARIRYRAWKKKGINLSEHVAYRLTRAEQYADNFAYKCLDLLQQENLK